MKEKSFLLAALLAAVLLPSQAFAQPYPRNTNQSARFKSGIFKGSGNLIMSNSRQSVIAGGAGNSIDGWYSTVGGGDTQRLTGDNVTISGGGINTAGPSRGATVGGGLYNTASGEGATVPGGQRGQATHDGSFVWSGDTSGETTASFGDHTFTIRCEGGAQFYTANGTTTGVSLAAGSGTWTSLSDRNAKENFDDVNASEVLAKVAAMPIRTWNYKTQADSIRHIGPTAQDFRAAFGVGESDTGITTVDADGVALAAIQGLLEELKRRDKTIEELKLRSAGLEASSAKVDRLESELRAIREQLGNMPPVP
jgi:hypothetical protein